MHQNCGTTPLMMLFQNLQNYIFLKTEKIWPNRKFLNTSHSICLHFTSSFINISEILIIEIFIRLQTNSYIIRSRSRKLNWTKFIYDSNISWNLLFHRKISLWSLPELRSKMNFTEMVFLHYEKLQRFFRVTGWWKYRCFVNERSGSIDFIFGLNSESDWL